MKIRAEMFFVIGSVLLAVLWLGLFRVCAENPREDRLAQGKKIYLRECSTCHGDQGKGDGPAAIAMVPKPRNFARFADEGDKTESRLFIKISGGASPMPAYRGTLSETQIRDVIVYIRTLFAKSVQK